MEPLTLCTQYPSTSNYHDCNNNLSQWNFKIHSSRNEEI